MPLRTIPHEYNHENANRIMLDKYIEMRIMDTVELIKQGKVQQNILVPRQTPTKILLLIHRIRRRPFLFNIYYLPFLSFQRHGACWRKCAWQLPTEWVAFTQFRMLPPSLRRNIRSTPLPDIIVVTRSSGKGKQLVNLFFPVCVNKIGGIWKSLLLLAIICCFSLAIPTFRRRSCSHTIPQEDENFFKPFLFPD